MDKIVQNIGKHDLKIRPEKINRKNTKNGYNIIKIKGST